MSCFECFYFELGPIQLCKLRKCFRDENDGRCSYFIDAITYTCSEGIKRELVFNPKLGIMVPADRVIWKNVLKRSENF